MAVQIRPTWQTVTLAQVQKMPLWQLKELSEARKRDQKHAAQQASTTEQVAFEKRSTAKLSSDEQNPSTRLEESTPADSSSRSVRKSSRTRTYSRQTRSQTLKNKKGISEANARPAANGETHVLEDGCSDANRQSAQEITVIIGHLRKELNEVDEEDRVALQDAMNVRTVTARLKQTLAYEQAKSNKLVNFLEAWQKSHTQLPLAAEETPEPERDVDHELETETFSRLKRDFQSVVSNKQFSKLQRRFTLVELEKNRSDAEGHISDDADSGSKNKENKGKEKEQSTIFNVPQNGGKDKGKGKAKEDEPTNTSTNRKKRTFSEALLTDPGLINALEQAHVNIALLRSRNEAARRESSHQPEASGSCTRLPQASGSGTRLLKNATRSPEKSDNEEPPLRRRKVH